MDLVSAWKAISIVLAGAFGILGLLQDYKDKQTNKITVWGRVSLIGILVSTSLGVTAQLKESSDQEKLRVATANQALALAQKTDKAVTEIQRSLSPLTDDAHFSISLTVPCTVPQYKRLCDTNVNSMHEDLEKTRAYFKIKFNVFFDLFRSNGQADRWIAGSSKYRDMMIIAEFDSSVSTFVIARENQVLKLSIGSSKSHIYINDGGIDSILDLPGMSAVVDVGTGEDWTLSRFFVSVKNGRSIDSGTKIDTVGGDKYGRKFRCVLPTQQGAAN